MNRSKLNPMVPLDELRHEMERLFENFVGTSPGDLLRGHKMPSVDVWEQNDLLLIQAEVPGVSMDQLEVYVVGKQLTIKGHRPSCSSESVCLHRQEQQTGDFERTLTLPVEIDPDRMEAKLDNGLLTITVTKPVISGVHRVQVKCSGPPATHDAS